MKDCREGFERLASDSCGLVYAISGIHTEGAASVELSGHINELLGYVTSLRYELLWTDDLVGHLGLYSLSQKVGLNPRPF